MSKVFKSLAAWSAEALMLAGAGAVSYGVALVFVPAGWIVAGGFLLGVAYLMARAK